MRTAFLKVLLVTFHERQISPIKMKCLAHLQSTITYRASSHHAKVSALWRANVITLKISHRRECDRGCQLLASNDGKMEEGEESDEDRTRSPIILYKHLSAYFKVAQR
jgi:hypothetical protein